MRWPRGDERGSTLVESLVATLVLALGAGAGLSMLAATLTGSAAHREAATFSTLLSDAVELTTYQLELAPSPLFLDCSASNSLLDYYRQQVTLADDEPGYTVSISGVAVYDPATGAFDRTSCPAGSPGDGGLELVTLEVRAPNGDRATQSVVVRDPLFQQADADVHV